MKKNGEIRGFKFEKNSSIRYGTWTKEEHSLFLKGLAEIGASKWKEISKSIPTRTADQTRSHAQKYFRTLRNKKRKQKETREEEDAAIVVLVEEEG